MTPSRETPEARHNAVRFVLDGEVITLHDVDPTRTVLQLLREDVGRVGTKEGCAEGDCGACTVVVAELDDDSRRLTFQAINSCIQFVPTLDGKALVTVESLRKKDGSLHPVQQAMVDCHGSQCGFCTPGFVMSLFALYKTKDRPSRREIDDALAGNLCRCTGYRPIIDAAVRMYDYGESMEERAEHWMNCSFASAGAEEPDRSERETVDLLRSLQRRRTLTLAANDRKYLAPRDLEGLTSAVHDHPDACVLAGGTDVGLWVTKQHRDLNCVIYVGNVRELKRISVNETHIEIGAAATLSAAMPVVLQHYPQLEDLFLRFASPPIRNAATLGGNLANGSPIGDSMPVLIAIGATVVLHSGNETRELPLEEFYLDYQKTALRRGEILTLLRIPLPRPHSHLRTYKISKRFDQDISAVCGAYRLDLDGTKVSSIRIAYGGVAAVPKRAPACEKRLTGHTWNEASVRAAMAMLDRDFTPISDMRATAEYRRLITRNLLFKFYLQTSGLDAETSLYAYGR